MRGALRPQSSPAGEEEARRRREREREERGEVVWDDSQEISLSTPTSRDNNNNNNGNGNSRVDDSGSNGLTHSRVFAPFSLPIGESLCRLSVPFVYT